jgi:hypothetical protein
LCVIASAAHLHVHIPQVADALPVSGVRVRRGCVNVVTTGLVNCFALGHRWAYLMRGVTSSAGKVVADISILKNVAVTG